MEPKPRAEKLSQSAEPLALCERHQHLERMLERGVGCGRRLGRGNPLYVSGCHELFIKDAMSDNPTVPGKAGFGGCKGCHATQVQGAMHDIICWIFNDYVIFSELV